MLLNVFLTIIVFLFLLMVILLLAMLAWHGWIYFIDEIKERRDDA